MAASKKVEVKVGRRTLELSNLDKVLYPKAGFTKAQVIDYYREISPVLLPHLRNRPLTMKRYPDGVEGGFFYEKECPRHRPKWVSTVAVWTASKERDVNYCLANDLETLVWAANLADLELHTSLARAPRVDRPTMMVFDLDPGPPAAISECCRIALELRSLLQDAGLESYAKTSGSKGLQLYVPLNSPANFDQTKRFAQSVALRMEKDMPKDVVSEMKKSLRQGKVFIDWSQNDDHKTTICVYSLRAMERPTVSTPVDWKEVASGVKDPAKLEFESSEVQKRVKRKGDLFEPVLKQKQKLPSPEVLGSTDGVTDKQTARRTPRSRV